MQGQYRFHPLGIEQYTHHLLAATCTDPPVPPGLESFPRPGEVYLSPALDELRATDQRIATRHPRVDGVIGRDGLVSSNELFAVVGVQPVTGTLPLGVVAFDEFGSGNDYLANYLRFGPVTLVVIGLFFTLLPTAYLIFACTRLNARTRERQLGLLAVMGVGPKTLRWALVIEAVVTVAAGALIGTVVALPVLNRVTPTFVGWTAFPGDLALSWTSVPVVLALSIALTVAASWFGARTSRGRNRRGRESARGKSDEWRWGLLTVGLLAAVVTTWWNDDSAWPVVLGGRVATFLGLLVVVPPLCAWLGTRLSSSDDADTSLMGTRLRRPSGALTRALGALTAGLFVLSAGATTVDAAGEDPAALQQGYAADGYSVVEVRRPSEATRQQLTGYAVLTGTNTSTDPNLVGTLTGSCATASQVTGGPLDCTPGTVYGVTYDGQVPPVGSDAQPVTLSGPRAEALSGFIITFTDQAAIGPADDDILIPLPVAEADRLYDQLVGADPAVNVRIAGAATVSGANQLEAILDVFRWGAAFAAVVALLAALISLVALLLDRQPGNNYLQVLGVTRRRISLVLIAEVVAAAGATVAVGALSAWLWARSLARDDAPISLLTVSAPFIAALVVLTAAAAALVWSTLRRTGVGVVPDRDGLVAAHDVFETAGSAR